MEQARLLLTALWQPFSFFSLFSCIALALLLGAAGGLLLAFKLHHSGWLARNASWHHGLLKLYFLLLPLAGGLLGLQGGLLYGSQQQLYRHLDSFTPALQVLADDTWRDFQAYVEVQDEQSLMVLRGSSIQDVLNQMARDYLHRERLLAASERADASMLEHMALELFDRLQVSLLGKAIGELVVDKSSAYSGLNKQVLTQVLDARIEQLFQAEFLLALLKRQLTQIFKPLYMALLLQIGLLLVLIAAEWGVSRGLRQTPTRRSAGPVSLL
ncbi:conserved membrane hypothetical protein [Pseudomonas sp. 8Z]|uniref:hypothetical protein n=1 Tax=Pseudomonas sp. 8Z TaxID=2653166 RepID=UPI0012F2A06E|nr:hypothetical protein [Pseudomonas sp. 8Z]VXC26764.1 conserved membrane hypothetical protein [Pseudomonas sp. 8Z]